MAIGAALGKRSSVAPDVMSDDTGMVALWNVKAIRGNVATAQTCHGARRSLQ